MQVNITGSATGGSCDVEMPSDLHLMHSVTHEGHKALARTLSIQGSRLKGLSDSMKTALLNNSNFFRTNTLLCAAYISEEDVLEVSVHSMCICMMCSSTSGSLCCKMHSSSPRMLCTKH